MKITARVNGENQSLVDTLKQRDITAKLVKGGVIVELPRSQKGGQGGYEIPTEINGAKLFIDAKEIGGGMTNTGSGTVVCGLSGKALRPYYVPRRGQLSCGVHAHFSVPVACVTVTGYRHDNEVTIKEHRIIQDDNVARIETRDIWEGQLEILPETLNQFLDAAKAASQKGDCYHCRHVHYCSL